MENENNSDKEEKIQMKKHEKIDLEPIIGTEKYVSLTLAKIKKNDEEEDSI